jgi:hypothetical protein
MSDSEIYLSMVNSKIWDYTQPDFALGTLEFCGCSFVLGCAHTTLQTQSCSRPMLSVLGFKVRMRHSFPKYFEPKPDTINFGLFCYCRMTE